MTVLSKNIELMSDLLTLGAPSKRVILRALTVLRHFGRIEI